MSVKSPFEHTVGGTIAPMPRPGSYGPVLIYNYINTVLSAQCIFSPKNIYLEVNVPLNSLMTLIPFNLIIISALALFLSACD